MNVNVVPMETAQLLPDQTVLIQHGWITALGPSRKVRVPTRATRIDGRNRYLVPGLADMHAHISMFARGDSAKAERMLFRWLADGVTTVRVMDWITRVNDRRSAPDMEAYLAKRTLLLRARAAGGTLLSPQIHAAGRWMQLENFTYAELDSQGRNGVWRMAPGDVARQIAAYQAAGFDFVKVRLEPLEIFDSVAAAARRIGLPIEGHVPPNVPIERAFAAPMKSIEHLTGYLVDRHHQNLWRLPEGSGVAALVAATKRAKIWNCPTQSVMAESSDSTAVVLRRQLIKALQAAGTGLLLGTDREPGEVGLSQELESLVEAGLTPYQALATGTKNVAVFLGTLAQQGTVAIGKRADLVLIRGNPLADIRHVREPVGVMLGGRWLNREELDQRLSAGRFN